MTEQPMPPEIPDFGVIRIPWGEMVLESKAIVPGLSLQDLMGVFHEAKRAAEPGDATAGNPSRWPDVRGVKAVTTAILHAIYVTKPP